ncbi:MAG TPA: hypothetical protein VGE58_06480, partial [Daejeonella sp.]
FETAISLTSEFPSSSLIADILAAMLINPYFCLVILMAKPTGYSSKMQQFYKIPGYIYQSARVFI